MITSLPGDFASFLCCFPVVICGYVCFGLGCALCSLVLIYWLWSLCLGWIVVAFSCVCLLLFSLTCLLCELEGGFWLFVGCLDLLLCCFYFLIF